MRYKNLFPALALASVLLLPACGGLPQHAQTRVEAVSSLIIKGGPKGAVVLIDGAEAGRISSRQTRVAIPNGTHTVTVTAQGQKIWEQAVFAVDGSQKIIQLSN